MPVSFHAPILFINVGRFHSDLNFVVTQSSNELRTSSGPGLSYADTVAVVITGGEAGRRR